MASSYRELQAMSVEQLIAEHDRLASTTQLGLSYYLDEIRRRENEKLATEMNALTLKVAVMTKRIELLTWAAVVASIIGILIALLK